LALNNNHSLTQSKLNQKYELSPLFYCLYKMTDYLSCSSFLQWIRRCVPLVKQKLYTVPESLVSHQIYSGNLIVHFAQVHVYTVLVSCCIAGKGNYVYFVFTPIWAVRIHVFYVIYLSCTNSCFLCYLFELYEFMFFMLFIWAVRIHVFYVICIIYECWCSVRITYHMMFLSFQSNTTGATGGAGTSHISKAH
jgi:hypothetical protein